MKIQPVELRRPNRSSKIRMYDTPSCWDCEHIKVGRQFHRICNILPGTNIWSGDPENERKETGKVIAEQCCFFEIANEYK